jgi:hypothetical protein
MKNLKKILLVAFVFLNAIVFKAADCSTPSLDCTPWLDPVYPNDCEFLTYGDCNYEIYYKTRECTVGNYTYKQIRIYRIEIYPDGGTCPDNNILMNWAIQWMLYLSPWRLGISDPQNEFEVNLITPRCVYRDTVSGPPVRYRIVGCADSCCSSTFTMQKVDTVMVIQDSKNDFTGSPCYIGPNFSNCQYNCVNSNFFDGTVLDFRYSLDCEDPCPEIKFETWGYKTLPVTIKDGPLSHNYYLNYGSRICNDIPELTITSLFDLKNIRYDFTLEALMNAAIKKLLSETENIFNTPLPCTVVVRNPQCWNDITYNASYPCGNTTCCATTYTVYEFNNTIYADTIRHYDGVNPYQCPDGCNDLCGANIIVNEVVPDMYNPTYIYEDEISNDSEIKILPHPANGKTEIIYTSTIEGDLELILYDILGNEVFRLIKNKNSRTLNFDIDVSNLSNGVYQIIIVKKGILLIKNNFIINK